MYQRLGASAYKSDLSNTLKLVSYLGNPQNDFKSVHIAGTNGKGSTSHMMASVFQEAGYKVGLYTSPHLKDFRERIKINGKLISKENVVHFIEKHQSFFLKNKLSFFEMTVGMAFDFFKNEKVDIAIIEVGMGGRLDSTNVIKPEIAVITNIGLDHTRFLGETIKEIALEKAGVIKTETPVVIGEYKEETKAVFLKKSKQEQSPIVFAEDISTPKLELDLLGDYQLKNSQTAYTAFSVLKQMGWNISKETIQAGLKKVIVNTGLIGRWQILNHSPKIICDTAHNRDGLTFVMKQLGAISCDQLHIVLGFVDDKNIDIILPLFPKNATYYFCKPNVDRGLDEDKLKQKASQYTLLGQSYSSVNEAYKKSLKVATKNDVIFVGGSTFVVAEVL
jgi:dihydrofolate synthase/folylpolyglutamate synthase